MSLLTIGQWIAHRVLYEIHHLTWNISSVIGIFACAVPLFLNGSADLFRLMSKANKYSGQQGNRRKKNKADQYAFMTGAMLHQNGIQTPDYQIYHDAYNHGPKHGMQPQMLDDFRSGTMQQKRHTRRQQNGRYNGRDKGQNQKKGKKNHSDSMFDFFDSDTSSSSEEE